MVDKGNSSDKQKPEKPQGIEAQEKREKQSRDTGRGPHDQTLKSAYGPEAAKEQVAEKVDRQAMEKAAIALRQATKLDEVASQISHNPLAHNPIVTGNAILGGMVAAADLASQPDKQALTEILKNKSDAERKVICEIYEKKYHTKLETDLGKVLIGADLDRTRNYLSRQDNRADNSGFIHATLEDCKQNIVGQSLGFHNAAAEEVLRKKIGAMSAQEIKTLDAEYRERYKTSLRNALTNNPHLSLGTQQSFGLLLSGADKRNDGVKLALADIALDQRDQAMFQEAMQGASSDLRKKFLSNHGDEKIKQAFGDRIFSNEFERAKEIAHKGEISLATEIRENVKNVFHRNDKAIDQSLAQMSLTQRKHYLDGRKLCRAEERGEKPPTIAGAEEKKQYYKEVHAALQEASSMFPAKDDTRVKRWEDMIAVKGGTLISRLADHKGMPGFPKTNEALAEIESLKKADWERLKVDPGFKNDVKAMLGSYLQGNDYKRAADLLEKKAAAKTFEESESQRRTLKEAAKDNEGFFGIGANKENVIKAIAHMSVQDQKRYREDQNYRKDVDEQVAFSLHQPEEIQAAKHMLARIRNNENVKAGKEPAEDIVAKLYMHAGKQREADEMHSSISRGLAGANPLIDIAKQADDMFNQGQARKDLLGSNKSEVIGDLKQAFAGKAGEALRERLRNPQTDADRVYAKSFNDALRKALTPQDYSQYAKPLLETGKLSLDKQAALQKKSLLVTDKQALFQVIAGASEEERGRLANDRAFQEKVFANLNSDERKAALHALEQKGELSPADHMRLYLLGVETKEKARESLSKLQSDKEKAALKSEYASKYGQDLFAALSGKQGSEELIKLAGHKAKSDVEAYNEALESYGKSRAADNKAFTDGWFGDGTGIAVDRQINTLKESMSGVAEAYKNLPAEEQKKVKQGLIENMSKVLEAHKQSKEEVAEGLSNVAIGAAAVGGAAFTGGVSLGLLATVACTSGAVKVAIKSAGTGGDYDSHKIATDVVTGMLEGGLNFLGPAEAAMALNIGKQAALKAAERTLLDQGVKQVLAKGAEESVETNMRKMMAHAIATNAKEIPEQEFKRLAGNVVSKDLQGEARKQAVEKIANRLKSNFAEELAQRSKNFLKDQARELSLTSGSGVVGGGASGLVGGATEWDKSKTASENLSVIGERALSGALGGGVGAAGFTLAAKGGGNLLEAAGKAFKRSNSDIALHGDQIIEHQKPKFADAPPGESARAQSNNYTTKHRVEGKLEPGFTDAGAGRYISKDGSFSAPRSATTVDLANDQALKQTLAKAEQHMQKFKGMSQAKREEELTKFVQGVFTPNPKLSLGENQRLTDALYMQMMNQNQGKRIPLGEFIQRKTGGCAQQAILLKVLGDELVPEAKFALVRGNGSDGGNVLNHVWIESASGKIFDPRQRIYGEAKSQHLATHKAGDAMGKEAKSGVTSPEQTFQPGSRVGIGNDNGWKVQQVLNDGKTVEVSHDGATKISSRELAKANPSLRLQINEAVVLPSKDGKLDTGWKIRHIDRKTGDVVLYKEDAVRIKIPKDQLSRHLPEMVQKVEMRLPHEQADTYENKLFNRLISLNDKFVAVGSPRSEIRDLIKTVNTYADSLKANSEIASKANPRNKPEITSAKTQAAEEVKRIRQALNKTWGDISDLVSDLEDEYEELTSKKTVQTKESTPAKQSEGNVPIVVEAPRAIENKPIAVQQDAQPKAQTPVDKAKPTIPDVQPADKPLTKPIEAITPLQRPEAQPQTTNELVKTAISYLEKEREKTPTLVDRLQRVSLYLKGENIPNERKTFLAQHAKELRAIAGVPDKPFRNYFFGLTETMSKESWITKEYQEINSVFFSKHFQPILKTKTPSGDPFPGIEHAMLSYVQIKRLALQGPDSLPDVGLDKAVMYDYIKNKVTTIERLASETGREKDFKTALHGMADLNNLVARDTKGDKLPLQVEWCKRIPDLKQADGQFKDLIDRAQLRKKVESIFGTERHDITSICETISALNISPATIEHSRALSQQKDQLGKFLARHAKKPVNLEALGVSDSLVNQEIAKSLVELCDKFSQVKDFGHASATSAISSHLRAIDNLYQTLDALPSRAQARYSDPKERQIFTDAIVSLALTGLKHPDIEISLTKAMQSKNTHCVEWYANIAKQIDAKETAYLNKGGFKYEQDAIAAIQNSLKQTNSDWMLIPTAIGSTADKIGIDAIVVNLKEGLFAPIDFAANEGRLQEKGRQGKDLWALHIPVDDLHDAAKVDIALRRFFRNGNNGKRPPVFDLDMFTATPGYLGHDKSKVPFPSFDKALLDHDKAQMGTNRLTTRNDISAVIDGLNRLPNIGEGYTHLHSRALDAENFSHKETKLGNRCLQDVEKLSDSVDLKTLEQIRFGPTLRDKSEYADYKPIAVELARGDAIEDISDIHVYENGHIVGLRANSTKGGYYVGDCDEYLRKANKSELVERLVNQAYDKQWRHMGLSAQAEQNKKKDIKQEIEKKLVAYALMKQRI